MPPIKFSAGRAWVAVQLLLLAGTVAAAALLSHPDEWQPLSLVALLFCLALAGEWFSVENAHGVVSASLAVMTLAIGLLGPAPAAICGALAIGLHSAIARRTPREWLNNLTGFAVAAFVGGLTVRLAVGDVAGPHTHGVSQSIVFGLVLLAADAVLLLVNFVIYATESRVQEGRGLVRTIREIMTSLPGEMTVAVVAIALALAYRRVGISALLAAIPVLVIFQQLIAALIRSELRGEQLDARTRQLATFQWAVPSTFMEGLGLRDPTAMRHGAAVASYAKALALELGCGEDEQEVIHLAGLLHDIGKFTWSDRILHPVDPLTDADWEVIRRHPQDGAMMLGKFDGFGPVAEAILHHHERIDGRGYPAQLIASEIPLASRIIAVASTYDAMTKRDTFGEPMGPDEAIAELRRISGTQLDAELVEAFISLLDQKGPTFGQEADYRSELEFEGRVRKMAQPQTPVQLREPAAVRLRRRG